MLGSDAAGEQHTHRHIGHELPFYGQVHALAGPFDGARFIHAVIHLEGQVPIAVASDSLGPGGHPVGHRHFVDALESGLLAGDVIEGQEIVHGLEIDAARHARILEDALDFGAEQQAVAQKKENSGLMPWRSRAMCSSRRRLSQMAKANMPLSSPAMAGPSSS